MIVMQALLEELRRLGNLNGITFRVRVKPFLARNSDVMWEVKIVPGVAAVEIAEEVNASLDAATIALHERLADVVAQHGYSS